MVDEHTKLQQISDVAWIVQQGNKRVGILNRDVQNHYTFISGKTVEIFDNDSEVREHFGNIRLFEEKISAPTSVPDGIYIRGHLVDYPDPVPVEPEDPNYSDQLPLYYKTQSSDILYAAGWYCICFEKGWKLGHGPKLSTLTEYGFRGPFRTELECKQQVKALNKQRKHNK
jgi:hypothetical protein